MGGAFGDRRRGQLVGVLGEKLGLRQVGGVRHAPPPLTAALLPSPCPRACAALLSPGAITSRWLQTTPGRFLRPRLLPFPSQVWAVCGRKTQSHGEPPRGTVAGLTMRGPGLQAGEEDLPGKVPGEFSSPSVCRPAWKMLRWGESRGRTSQQPVWLILPAPRAFALSVPSAWGVLPLPSSPRWRLCILPHSA